MCQTKKSFLKAFDSGYCHAQSIQKLQNVKREKSKEARQNDILKIENEPISRAENLKTHQHLFH